MPDADHAPNPRSIDSNAVWTSRRRWFSARFSTAPALVAQWIEHRFPKPGVAGSIPAGGTTAAMPSMLTP
jgi:hypothetical protein